MKLRISGLLAIATFVLLGSAQSLAQNAYITNGSNSVSVIDTATNTVTATITDAVLVLALVISTFLPSGLTATPKGKLPTGIVAVMVLVALSITDTLLEPAFAMKAFCARL